MHLELVRYSSGPDDSLGLLFVVHGLDRRFLCYTLEDEHRGVKLRGETRIPEGTYTLALRTTGGMHAQYARRFDFHRGMLWVCNVPGFTWIYLHIGNDEGDTDGCPLLGDQVLQNVTGKGRLLRSTEAYHRVYPPIAEALLEGRACTITVIDQA